jgi:hypothetical protein
MRAQPNAAGRICTTPSVLKQGTIRARSYAMCVSLASHHARVEQPCAALRMRSERQWISRSRLAPKPPRGSRHPHPHVHVLSYPKDMYVRRCAELVSELAYEY